MLADVAKEFVGKGGGTTILEVEKGAIRRFADAVGDMNPLFRDDEYARNSKNGTIVSLPGFFGWPSRMPRGTAVIGGMASELSEALADGGYLRVLDGGMDYEFFVPVRAGDTLSSTTALKDVREREGSTGKMAIVRNETTYHNQNGDLVATAVSTTIYR